MGDVERYDAYMAAYLSLEEGRAPRPKKRKKLLAQFVKVAGWSDETVRRMQIAATLPIR